ncbi:carboxylate-amine ligase [Flammeovirga kamogawensis]|uniref:Putative glutamate--cysteine ligase 2 n=1 Tax=Flammeovirga kamogawensis TaxID=373891 RepID=A0ABX8GY75_9BACT|nr:carboxylate-amine ligase [Flammeovirga kamogawensis]MBB6460805.1 carboxylate-amine ligase [Flammeovirga kamogawensis]QWG08157.1 carboxylate-amine ligase [Flammeovirga kamogawensis]TRX69960.1 carboxylate-amine ligase [Flammeovirga kamogawensis]
MSKKFTIGIEEEFQTVSMEDLSLKAHLYEILDQDKKYFHEHVKPEMHKAVLEVGTHICENIDEARKDVVRLRNMAAQMAGDQDQYIAAAGSHPFSSWTEQLMTDDPRYNQIVNELQDAARSNLIFGMHVHVGIENRNQALHLMNQARYFLPHIFALSTNSPFWEGRNTGYMSYRTKVFDKFPRTGIPEFYASAAEYDEYIEMLTTTNCIDNAKKIWWDIRMHPFYNTIEFRICDVQMTTEETLAIASLVQAIVCKLDKLMRQNMSFRIYRRALVNENKWRAARYGLEGKLIDFGKREEVDSKQLILEILDFVDDVVDELGSRDVLETIPALLEKGTGARRQLEIFKQSNSLEDVAKYIVQETNKDLDTKLPWNLTIPSVGV